MVNILDRDCGGDFGVNNSNGDGGDAVDSYNGDGRCGAC